MKKLVVLIAILALCLSLFAGCAAEGAASKIPSVSAAPSVEDILAGSPSPTANDTPAPAAEPGETMPPNLKSGSADVDLTLLSSTMIYAEVYNIMSDPDAYVGKTIKLRGLYASGYYEPTEQWYHFAIIPDATACCSGGLEFLWVGGGDFPETDTEVEIVGVFEPYDEFGETYYRINSSSVQVV